MHEISHFSGMSGAKLEQMEQHLSPAHALASARPYLGYLLHNQWAEGAAYKGYFLWREVETMPLSHMAIMLHTSATNAVVNEFRQLQKIPAAAFERRRRFYFQKADDWK